MEYVLHIVVVIALYTVLAVSLDLLAGHTGLLSLAHAAFYGLGAYTSALLTVRLGTSFLVGVLAGMVVASIASLAVSLPSLRLHEDYFVVATFGFQVIVSSIFNNWTALTNGPLGVSGIPYPSLVGFSIESSTGFVFLTALFAVFAHCVVTRLSTSPLGRVLRSIREDEVFCQSLGKNTLWFKVTAFAVSGTLAAMAGAFYAHYVTYIDPTSFTVTESILVIAMVIIGGAGGIWGPVVGAVVLVVLPELLRFAGLPSATAANLRQVIYGGSLVLMMLVRPRGLFGRFGFGR
jgi:branched-chain amino acid transport system permease protein